MRKALWTLVACAFFALLLSALVVSPAAETGAADASPAVISVSLLPLALPAPEPAAPPVAREQYAHPALLADFSPCAFSAPVSLRCDANGRVLCARRYENSYYPLFRQEIAGG